MRPHARRWPGRPTSCTPTTATRWHPRRGWPGAPAPASSTTPMSCGGTATCGRTARWPRTWRRRSSRWRSAAPPAWSRSARRSPDWLQTTYQPARAARPWCATSPVAPTSLRRAVPRPAARARRAVRQRPGHRLRRAHHDLPWHRGDPRGPGDAAPHVHFVLLGYGEPDYLATLQARVAARWAGAAGALRRRGGPRRGLDRAGRRRPLGGLRASGLPVLRVQPAEQAVRVHPCRLPVAAADLPDTAAVVREHGVGEIFDADSPADMARTISTVLADPQRYRDASRAAAEVLTWQHEEAELLGLYRRGPAPVSRPRLLVIAFSPLRSDARVLRQVRLFRERYAVTTVGYGPAPRRCGRRMSASPTRSSPGTRHAACSCCAATRRPTRPLR